MARKVLYSPGFGAGWSTWNREYGSALALDEKLVELCSAGKVLLPNHPYSIEPEHLHPEFLARVREITGGKDPYYGGLRDLTVAEVAGSFRITEYDGSESIETRDELESEWW